MENNRKQITARFGFKYDTLANWEQSQLILLQGEPAIACEIETNEDGEEVSRIIQMKIGDGDHSWKDLPDSQTFISEKTVNELIAEAGDSFKKEAYETFFSEISDTDATTPKTESVAVLGAIAEVADAEKGINKIEETFYNMPTQVAVDNALAAAKDYADKYFSDGVGTTVTTTTTEDKVAHSIDLNIDIALTEKDDGKNYLCIYQKGSTDDAIAEMDASQFLVDGMLSAVNYDKDTNTLTFTWNTDGGKEETSVDLSEMLTPNEFQAGARLELDQELLKTGVIKYSHEQIAAPTGSTGAGSVYLTGVTTDGYGHITGYTTVDTTTVWGDKKDVQTPVALTGSTTQTITALSQDAQGVISATFEEIAFPQSSGEVDAYTYDEKTKIITLNGGVKLENHVLKDGTKADMQLAKVAATNLIEDLDQKATVHFICGGAFDE